MQTVAAARQSRPLVSGVLPGFALASGTALLFVALLVVLPLSALVGRTLSLGWRGFWHGVTSPRLLHSYLLSFGLALAAAAVSGVMGLLLAWVLARYRFPGRRLMDGLIDLPFALPTAVAGIALTALYSEKGWVGAIFAAHGIAIAFTPFGILMALIFVGLPFQIRTLQPVIGALDRAWDEAAATLGANGWQVFRLVLLPELKPALWTGFGLAFARGLGEYGSVVFIAGNIPLVSEITPVLIVTKLEQYDEAGAAAVAVLLLGASLLVLAAVRGMESRAGRYLRTEAAR